jgi:uncharacterized protein YuzE
MKKNPNKKAERGIKSCWFDYDEGADVLHVHFTEPPSSNQSEIRDDGIIFDYREKALVALMILDASQR